MADLKALERQLGYVFQDKKLLSRALTHASITPLVSNQRLEFLGDAVLELCISDLLYHLDKSVDEGSLTRRRQQLVCEGALAQVARGLGIGDCLRMKPELVRAGGRKRPSLLADAMEAVIAAVYLDGGLTAVSHLVKTLWASLMPKADDALDAKGALQAYLQGKGLPQPEYQLINQEGPPHSPRFESAVYASGRELARAWGDTIKQAQQLAASRGLSLLQREEADDEINPA